MPLSKSRTKRRSGIAVVQVCEGYDWRPDCVVMVGVGSHHEELHEMVEAWPDVRVVGCEPHPKTAKGLRRLWEQEDFSKNWEVVEVAIVEKCGEWAMLYEKSRHKDGSSLYPHAYRNPKNSYGTHAVMTTTLDRLFAGNRTLCGALGQTLLWLDCEGSELQALQGGREFLRQVEFVNVEMTGKPNGDWAKPADVHAFLVDAGFRRTWCHSTRISNAQYDAVYVRQELLLPELCMCPCGLEQ